MVEIDMEQFRKSFLEEASDLLERANEDLLNSESSGDISLLHAVFRSIHTIKGSAAGFGFEHITEFSHDLETVLDKVRNQELELTNDVVDTCLTAIDGLFEMVDAAKENRDFNVDTEGVKAELLGLLGTKIEKPAEADKNPLSATVKPAGKTIKVDEELRVKLMENVAYNSHCYMLKVNYTDEMFENGYDPITVLSNIFDNSSFYFANININHIPLLSDFEPYKLFLLPELYIISELSADELKDFAIEENAIEVFNVDLDESVSDFEENNAEAEISTENISSAPLAAGGSDVISIGEMDMEMLKELLSGIEDYFDSIEDTVLKLESGKFDVGKGIDDLFRVFHNIKGDSGYVGFGFLEKFAHMVENLLDNVRSGKLTFDKKAADIILSVVSDVKNIFAAIFAGKTHNYPATYYTLETIAKNISELKVQKPILADAEIEIFMNQVNQFLEIIEIAFEKENDSNLLIRAASGLKNAAKYVKFDDLLDLASEFEITVKNGADTEECLTRIKRYIQSLHTPPTMVGDMLKEAGYVSDDDIVDAISKQRKIGEILVDTGKINPEQLETVLKKQTIRKITSDKADSSKQVEVSSKGAEFSGTMKVEQEKIDKFTNTIGELVIAKNAQEYLIHKLVLEYNLPSSFIKELKDNANLVARISQDLQRDILALRMMPIKQIFHKFPRIVRDISRKQNKLIELNIIGEDTEIDKKVADILTDPLVHLVRNSCDHGIEIPEVRKNAGKTDTGYVILKAYNEGSFVYIEVIDDGKGIDKAKVLEKAVAKGLVSSPEDISPKEICNLIFEPGFSTADQVTDISGRGVGMDVVKTSITNVGGTVDIQSEQGEGSRMVLKIPVTIGVSTVLLVELDDEYFAIPIENVAETIKVDKNDIKDLHYGKGIYYRGMVLPIYGLSALLDLEEKELRDEVSIVITVTDSGKIGLVVDELVNRMDVAIKPVPEYFSHLTYVGGITILGDGRAVLVINTNKLV